MLGLCENSQNKSLTKWNVLHHSTKPSLGVVVSFVLVSRIQHLLNIPNHTCLSRIEKKIVHPLSGMNYESTFYVDLSTKEGC